MVSVLRLITLGGFAITAKISTAKHGIVPVGEELCLSDMTIMDGDFLRDCSLTATSSTAISSRIQHRSHGSHSMKPMICNNRVQKQASTALKIVAPDGSSSLHMMQERNSKGVGKHYSSIKKR